MQVWILTWEPQTDHSEIEGVFNSLEAAKLHIEHDEQAAPRYTASPAYVWHEIAPTVYYYWPEAPDERPRYGMLSAEAWDVLSG